MNMYKNNSYLFSYTWTVYYSEKWALHVLFVKIDDQNQI